jgi:excisionase family DNA binding protein
MAVKTSSSQAGNERLWTVTYAAAYLRLEPETVRAMARRGELPVFKVGKRLWRFDPGKIKAWLDEHVI